MINYGMALLALGGGTVTLTSPASAIAIIKEPQLIHVTPKITKAIDMLVAADLRMRRMRHRH